MAKTKHKAKLVFDIELVVDSDEYDSPEDAINEMDYELKLPQGATLICAELSGVEVSDLTVPDVQS